MFTQLNSYLPRIYIMFIDKIKDSSYVTVIAFRNNGCIVGYKRNGSLVWQSYKGHVNDVLILFRKHKFCLSINGPQSGPYWPARLSPLPLKWSELGPCSLVTVIKGWHQDIKEGELMSSLSSTWRSSYGFSNLVRGNNASVYVVLEKLFNMMRGA